MNSSSRTEDRLLEEFVQRVKGDAKQSYFMKAYCDKSLNKFDLSLFKHWEQDLPCRIIRNLLCTGEIDEKLPQQVQGSSGKQLEALILRSKAEIKNTGNDSLCIGFPLVQKYDHSSGKVLLCPLILWKVNIDTTVSGRIVLQRNFMDPVHLNDSFCEYMRTNCDVDLRKTKSYRKSKDMFNEVDIENLISYLGFDISSEEIFAYLQGAMYSELPKVPAEAAIRGNPDRIIWGGLLSLFKADNTCILGDLETYQHDNVTLSCQPILSERHLRYSGIYMDPSQQMVMDLMSSDKSVVINGPPGTGKSNTLAAVISGLAANGMKTLVVCEKKTPLDILQQKLGEISSYNEWPASKFSAVITNVEERDDLVTKAQQNRLAVDTLSSESIAEYESMLINEVHRLEKDIVFEEDRFVRHRASTKAGVGFGMSFQDAVAWNIDHVLSGNTILPIIDGSLLLTSVFAPDHVKRIDRCEAQLGKEIVDALLLLEFKKITEFTADDVIAQAAELKDEIKKLLNHRHTILLKVKADIIAKYDVLCEVWNDRLTDLTKIASELRRIPAVAIEQFERGGWGETLFAFLTNSTQHRGVLRALSGRLNSIKAEINQRSQESPPGDFSLSNMQRIVHWCKGRLLHVETIGKNLTDKSLQHMWEENVFMIKHEMKTSHEELELVKYAMKNAIQNSLFCTAHSLTQFTLCFDILNTTESGWALDKLFLLFKNSNLSQWRSSADSINCLLSFGLLQDHNFLALFLGCKKTVSWGTRIKSAILSRELATKEDLMTSDFVLNKISDSMSQIRRNIQLLVVLRQAKAMKESVANFEANSCPRQKFEQLFNRASRNIRTNSLLEIVKELDLFTSCFPILFCTPEVASTLFKGVYGYFDLVVLDEASQSLPQETFACLLKGKKAILAGDRHQMPPTILFGGGGGVNILDLLDDETPEGNEMHYDSVEEVKSKQYIHRITQNAANAESILDFATDHSFYFAPVDLKFHYRSMNPDLMGFNAAAIYKNLALCPGKPIISARPAIQVTRVNGIYKDRSNRIEAEKILSILKKYVVGLDDESTIAIATFNESQQKMILNLLKHHPDHQFIMSIRTLQSQNRFFVKNLENLQGDEVDHLIIGTTFGPTSSGKFEKRFGRITFQGLGYRYLNVLFSRARQHVHIVTSIPPCEFMNAEMVREDNGQLSGLSFFYGYLRYATAISSGNRILAEQLLVEFNPENRSRPKEAIGSLEQVIGNHLRSRHSKYERLVNGEARSNSLLKGMMVRFDNGKCMVLESNTYESYSNCIYRKTILESFGYSYYHIWLKNWLDSPMNELVKLCQVVDDSIRKNRVVNPIIDAGDESRSSSPVSFQMNVIVSDEDSPTNKREMDDYADDDDVLMSDDGAYSSKAAKRQKCTNDVWDPKEMPEEEAVESFALNEPYLVKYGTHRKLIVFIPLAIVKRRGSRMLQGQWGTQQLRFPVHRLTPIASAPKNIKPDLFLNPVEFDKLKFYTSSTDTPPRSKMSTRASLSRSSGI